MTDHALPELRENADAIVGAQTELSPVRVRQALAFLTFAFALSQFFRSCLAVIAPEIQRDLDLSPDGFGNLSSCFFLAFGLSQIPVGVLFDRLGVGKPTALFLLLGTLSAMLFAVAPSGQIAMVAQSGLGLACAPIFMGLLYYAAEQLSDMEYSKFVGRANGIGMFGALVATGPLGWASHQFGWRASMGVASICIALACVGVWYSMKSDRRRGPWSHSMTAMYASSIRLLGIPALWALLPLCIAMAAGTTFRNTWGGPYLSDTFQMDIGVRGWALAFLSFGGMLSALVLPRLVRKFGLKQTNCGWSIVSLCAAVTLAYNPEINQYLAILTLAVISNIGMLHPLLMAHGRRLFHPSMRGRGLGVMNTFVFLGSAVASSVFGGIAAGGPASAGGAASVYTAMFSVAALAIIAALIPYLFSKD